MNTWISRKKISTVGQTRGSEFSSHHPFEERKKKLLHSNTSEPSIFWPILHFRWCQKRVMRDKKTFESVVENSLQVARHVKAIFQLTTSNHKNCLQTQIVLTWIVAVLHSAPLDNRRPSFRTMNNWISRKKISTDGQTHGSETSSHHPFAETKKKLLRSNTSEPSIFWPTLHFRWCQKRVMRDKKTFESVVENSLQVARHVKAIFQLTTSNHKNCLQTRIILV